MKGQPSLIRYHWKFSMLCIFLNVNLARRSLCHFMVFANTVARKKGEKKKEENPRMGKIIVHFP